jgi:hypothetical protein
MPQNRKLLRDAVDADGRRNVRTRQVTVSFPTGNVFRSEPRLYSDLVVVYSSPYRYYSLLPRTLYHVIKYSTRRPAHRVTPSPPCADVLTVQRTAPDLTVWASFQKTKPEEARAILNQQPQISYALIILMVKLNAINVEAITVCLHF